MSYRLQQLDQIGVIGGGSWATALVKVLTDRDVNLHWWMRNPETVEHIQQHYHNPRYLSSAYLNLENATVSTDLDQIIEPCDALILAIPAAFLDEAIGGLAPEQLQDKYIISGIKGILPEKHQLVAHYCNDKFGIDYEQLAVIAGPCHAEEIASEKLSYVTIACPNTDNAQQVADQLRTRYLSTHTTDDIFGTEYTAVLKNVIAMASGICHGLGYGDNFQAVLISNAVQEIRHFIDVVHPINRDIARSAYLGDLLVTAYSQHSRNRTFGNMIGKGYSVKSAQMEMNMIAEGYYAVKSIHEINKEHGAQLPIVNTVYQVLYKDQSPAEAFETLTHKLT
jgi:glycerol-3-phosphate dehydrogenase (NAD(P)+)